MSRYYPPKIKPLAPIDAPITTGDAARAQMLADGKITRANVFGQMDIPDAQRAELEKVMAMFSQMLIGDLSDEDALETFDDKAA